MIESLYKTFQHWSATGSVWIISDPHLNDPDCRHMDKNWPVPADYISHIKENVHKGDTLICLGDVGQPAWFKDIKAYKVLIKGNHDAGNSNYEPYFNEIYEGPLFIAEKILLSHEPIIGLPYVVNIHGHTHDKKGVYWEDELGGFHCNLCSNCVCYEPMNLGMAIKKGLLADIESIHRQTINRATERKNKV